MRSATCSLARARRAATGARAVLVTVAGLAVVGASACGGDGGGSAATADTRAAAPPAGEAATPAPLAPEEAAVTAYRSAYDAYLAALDPPDPASPDLPEHFGGDALGTILDTVLAARDQGVRVEAAMAMDPAVVSATGTQVVLLDCVVETNTVYDAASGEPTDSGTYVHHRRATVTNHDGAWVVEAFERLEEPCTPGDG